MNPETQAASEAEVPQMALTPRSLHTPGPWAACGARKGRCKCGQVWSELGDFPVATVTTGKWGDDYPSIRFTDGDGPGSINAKVEAYEAQLTYGEVPEEMALANAHLIAAAPELLDALRVAVKTLRTWEGMGMPKLAAKHSWELYQQSPEMRSINAAIAKAEGTPSDPSGNDSDDVTGASNKDLEEKGSLHN